MKALDHRKFIPCIANLSSAELFFGRGSFLGIGFSSSWMIRRTRSFPLSIRAVSPNQATLFPAKREELGEKGSRAAAATHKRNLLPDQNSPKQRESGRILLFDKVHLFRYWQEAMSSLNGGVRRTRSHIYYVLC